jgi:3-hydroxybutyryl-CoA dehydrogenase
LKLSLIGGGVMGRGLAYLALLKGFRVCLFNRHVLSSRESGNIIEQKQAEGCRRGKITAGQVADFLKALKLSTDLEEACSFSNFLHENVPEDVNIKKEVFRKMTLLNPRAILASNTSSLSLQEIASVCKTPENVIGLHFFNPPHAMKLLEIVCHEGTSESTYKKARALGDRLSRVCIRTRDMPGFASSRLSVCMGLEAIRMLEEGVASVADIDRAMELDYGHPMGPLKLGDLVGLDVRLAVARRLEKALGTATFKIPQKLENLVKAGWLGKKTGRGFYEWT